MRVLFSILRYQLVTEESMNLGVLFHNLSTDERRLVTISNWKRLEGFDDEVDIEMLKILIDGLNDEIKNDLFNKNNYFDIHDYPLKYVNELRFTRVYEANNVDNFDSFIDLTRKNYLRYDFDKKLRPDKKQQVKIMKQLMKSSSIKYSSKSIRGKYNEQISYDYTIGNYGFKIFTFEDKNIANLVSSAKAWAFTANEMKDSYDTIFLYDKDIDNKSFKTIMTVLKNTGCKIIKVDDGMDYIINLFEKIQLSSINEVDFLDKVTSFQK